MRQATEKGGEATYTKGNTPVLSFQDICVEAYGASRADSIYEAAFALEPALWLLPHCARQTRQCGRTPMTTACVIKGLEKLSVRV